MLFMKTFETPQSSVHWAQCLLHAEQPPSPTLSVVLEPPAAGWKCWVSGPTPNPLSQTLHLTSSPRRSQTHSMHAMRNGAWESRAGPEAGGSNAVVM